MNTVNTDENDITLLDRRAAEQCHLPRLTETSIALLTWLQHHALLHPYIDATTCLRIVFVFSKKTEPHKAGVR